MNKIKTSTLNHFSNIIYCKYKCVYLVYEISDTWVGNYYSPRYSPYWWITLCVSLNSIKKIYKNGPFN